MAYLLDANVFIAAKNLHYGLDFCPAFWDWLIAGLACERRLGAWRVGSRSARWWCCAASMMRAV